MKNAHGLDLRHIGLLFSLALIAAGCDFDFNLGNMFGGDNPPDNPYRPPGVNHIHVLAPANGTEIRLPARWDVSADSCNSTYFCDSVLQATIHTDSYITVDRVDIYAVVETQVSSLIASVDHPASFTFDLPYLSPRIYDSRPAAFSSDTVVYPFYAVLRSRTTFFYSERVHVRLIFHDSTRTDSLLDPPRMDNIFQRPLDSALVVSWCDRSFNEDYFLMYHMIADLPATDPDSVASAEWDYYFWHPLSNKRYSFFVQAHNLFGISLPSDTISIVTF